MATELGEFLTSITVNFCILDYTYEELGCLYHNEPLRKEIGNSGFEGAFFIDAVDTFLKMRGEDISLNKLPDFGGDEKMRKLHTYKLPFHIFNSIQVYYESLVESMLKQDPDLKM